MSIKLKILLKLFLGILGTIILLLIIASMILPAWRTPGSDDYYGIEGKAVSTRDPSLCSQLATEVGDAEPQGDCYWYSIIAINDVSLCDKYPVDAKFCRNTIASKQGNPALCAAETAPHDYNWCIYAVAGGQAGPKTCDLLKSGTAFTRDRCLLNIEEGLIQNNDQSTNNGQNEVSTVCNNIASSTLQDYCIQDVIIHTRNVSLCNLANPQNMTKGTISADICPNSPFFRHALGE